MQQIPIRKITMAISHIYKFIWNEVISVMCASWCCHGKAIDVENRCGNRKQWDKLKITIDYKIIRKMHSNAAFRTNENKDVKTAPFWMLMYSLFFSNGFWYHGNLTDFIDPRDFCDCKFDLKAMDQIQFRIIETQYICIVICKLFVMRSLVNIYLPVTCEYTDGVDRYVDGVLRSYCIIARFSSQLLQSTNKLVLVAGWFGQFFDKQIDWLSPFRLEG